MHTVAKPLLKCYRPTTSHPAQTANSEVKLSGLDIRTCRVKRVLQLVNPHCCSVSEQLETSFLKMDFKPQSAFLVATLGEPFLSLVFYYLSFSFKVSWPVNFDFVSSPVLCSCGEHYLVDGNDRSHCIGWVYLYTSVFKMLILHISCVVFFS